nr:histone deacetylase 14 [Tanacetum cinerariifolium]
MLWGVVTRTNVDYAELVWEEFIQAIKTFFSDAANLKTQYSQKAQSPVHITTDDYPLNNLKFVSKGGVDEVFRMPIPKDLITDAIQNSEYYDKYLEMAACKPRQPTTMTGEEVEMKKKAPKACKSTQPAPSKQHKHAKKKTSKPTPSKKIHKGTRCDYLIDEADEEPQPSSELQEEDDEYSLQRGIHMSLESLQALIGGVVVHEPDLGFIRKLPKVEGKGKVTQDASTVPSTQPQDDTSMNVAHDTLSPADSTNDAETAADMEQSNSKSDTKILNVVEEQGEEVSNMVTLEERTVEFDEGQDGSDPGKTPESRPLPEEDQAGSDPGQSYVAQAGPNPKPMHEDFIATVYPEVHESLMLTTKEQVHISSSETLSSMKNLKDAFTFESEDTGAAHLPKIKTRPDWLKPLLEEETPETSKPDWVIPPNDLPETGNKWTDAMAKTYKDPEENKLLQITEDMASFI